MKLKEILKAMQDGVKLEFQRGGEWYTLCNTTQLPGMTLDNDNDVDSIRIAKTYVTIGDVYYEVPTACKSLYSGQECWVISYGGVEHTVFSDKYSWHSLRLRDGLAFYTQEDAGKAYAILSATTNLFKK